MSFFITEGLGESTLITEGFGNGSGPTVDPDGVLVFNVPATLRVLNVPPGNRVLTVAAVSRIFTGMSAEVTKTATARRVFGFDLAPDLEDGVLPESVDWTVPSGLVDASDDLLESTVDGARLLIGLEGGTRGKTYEVWGHYVLDNGEEDDICLTVTIQ